MSNKVQKALAVLLLALSIAAVAAAVWSGQRRSAIQGPSALAVLADGTVWLSVDDALWRLAPDGRRLAVVPAASHRVPGLVANLVVHPSKVLVASTRDDATLYLLDAATGLPRSTLTPAWPPDLAEHGGRAISYAFHADGRLAISTGGGHAVALFDAQGRFIARTPPGTYEFTNGLWWRGETLWTTDTNRFALVALDGATMAPQARVTLPSLSPPWQYLGMATGPGAAPATLGSVVRLANGMIEGQVVQVRPGGLQDAYPMQATMEPRDLQWLGDTLLVVDGAGYAVRRFGADRQRLADFGDTTVRAELEKARTMREVLHQRYLLGLAAGGTLFVIGFALVWRGQHQEKAARLKALGADVSHLGTPLLTEWRSAQTTVRMFGPVLLGLAVLLLMGKAPSAWLPAGVSRALVEFSLMLVAMLVVAAEVVRHMRLARVDPAVDALLNQVAVRTLARSVAFWSQRDAGERPVETLLLDAPKGPCWVVLTDRRLLAFRFNLRDQVLEWAVPLGEVHDARMLQVHEMNWVQRLKALALGGAVLSVTLRDGEVLAGMTAAAGTAQRLVDALQGQHAPIPETAQRRRGARPAPAAARARARGWRDAAASLAVPGLGQWLQRRAGTALWMFVPWLVLLLAVAVPLAWTAAGPRAAVTSGALLSAAIAYAAVCLVAAWDAWRMCPADA